MDRTDGLPAAASGRLRGRAVRLWVDGSEVMGRVLAVRQAPDTDSVLALELEPSERGGQKRPHRCLVQLDDVFLTMLKADDLLARLVRMVEAGQPIRVTEVRATACPRCGTELTGPFCGRCGLGTSCRPLSACAPDGHELGEGPYCARCGQESSRGSGRFSRIR